MSERYAHASKDPICVQKNAISVGSTADDNGGLLYLIEVRPSGGAGDPLAIYPAYAELKVCLRLIISLHLCNHSPESFYLVCRLLQIIINKTREP
jgi:hypothetical protein